MKTLFSVLALSALLYSSCRPKPLSIEVPQKPALPVISSAMVNEHSILVSATYSFNSLLSVDDTVRGNNKVPPELLLKDVVVTIEGEGRLDTLQYLSNGVYGNNAVSFAEGKFYTLNINESKGTLLSTSRSQYFNIPSATVRPMIKKGERDTVVHLDIRMENVAADGYYFVSYATQRDQAAPVDREDVLKSLASFSPQQLLLLTGADIQNGRIDRNIRTGARPGDTLMVHCCRIEKAYYEYLNAYKKAGAFINRMTGEPINMPTNVVKGLGFYAMSVPVRKVFYLNDRKEYWKE